MGNEGAPDCTVAICCLYDGREAVKGLPHSNQYLDDSRVQVGISVTFGELLIAVITTL